MTRYKYILAAFFALCFCQTGFAVTQWRHLAPGLAYTKISYTPSGLWGSLHAFRIDLTKYQLQSVLAKQIHKQVASAKQFAKIKNALIAINGGFFTPDLQPIGLRIHEGKTLSPMKRTSWWGVFYTINKNAYVVAQKSFRENNKINFAVQGGPRLIVNKRIPSLKPGISARTALGINAQGEVIIVVSQNLALSTAQLAQFMRRSEKEDGLACVNALNLDGGTSSQLYASVNQLHLDLPNFDSITDAVIVLNRKK